MDKFYQELGHLFYAVASVDGKIAKEEIVELKKCIREEWLKFEDSVDEFGTDAAFQIETVFDWLRESGEKSSFAFHEFEEYYKSHPSLFKKEVSKLVLATCERIASSFKSQNKAEQELLKLIRNLFK